MTPKNLAAKLMNEGTVKEVTVAQAMEIGEASASKVYEGGVANYASLNGGTAQHNYLAVLDDEGIRFVPVDSVVQAMMQADNPYRTGIAELATANDAPWHHSYWATVDNGEMKFIPAEVVKAIKQGQIGAGEDVDSRGPTGSYNRLRGRCIYVDRMPLLESPDKAQLPSGPPGLEHALAELQGAGPHGPIQL